MKKLLLVRHAKSSWEKNVSDKDRPLTDGGVHFAGGMVRKLHEEIDFTPQFWACSYANRAMHTATIFAEYFEQIHDLKISKELYTFYSEDILLYIENLPNDVESAILFGHNNALFETINVLSNTFVNKFSTANVAFLQFNTDDWYNCKNGKLVFHLSQKSLS